MGSLTLTLISKTRHPPAAPPGTHSPLPATPPPPPHTHLFLPRSQPGTSFPLSQTKPGRSGGKRCGARGPWLLPSRSLSVLLPFPRGSPFCDPRLSEGEGVGQPRCRERVYGDHARAAGRANARDFGAGRKELKIQDWLSGRGGWEGSSREGGLGAWLRSSAVPPGQPETCAGRTPLWHTPWDGARARMQTPTLRSPSLAPSPILLPGRPLTLASR